MIKYSVQESAPIYEANVVCRGSNVRLPTPADQIREALEQVRVDLLAAVKASHSYHVAEAVAVWFVAGDSPTPKLVTTPTVALPDARAAEREQRALTDKLIAGYSVQSAAWEAYARDVVSDVSAPSDVSAIAATVSRVMDLIEADGPEHLALSHLHYPRMHAEHMVAVLRTSFVWSGRVPGWHQALNETAQALVAAGHDPDEVLVGLR